MRLPVPPKSLRDLVGSRTPGGSGELHNAGILHCKAGSVNYLLVRAGTSPPWGEPVHTALLAQEWDLLFNPGLPPRAQPLLLLNLLELFSNPGPTLPPSA